MWGMAKYKSHFADAFIYHKVLYYHQYRPVTCVYLTLRKPDIVDRHICDTWSTFIALSIASIGP